LKTPGFGKARSVLLIYASGGQSQIDLWDMKPNAPVEVRGEFKPIATSVPGLRICEHLPRLARIANLYTILRSVSHDDLDHGSATYLALTGQQHPRKSSNPPPQPTDYPTFGSLLHRMRPTRTLTHSSVHVNGPAQVPEVIGPGQFAGFLGRAHEPLQIGDVSGGVEELRGLEPLADVSRERRDRRQSLLNSLEPTKDVIGSPGQELEAYRGQAYQLLESSRFHTAFDLEQEPAKLRDAYGRHRSGQACLLGRRLVEAGVPWVTVIWNHTNRGQDKDPDDTNVYGWDTHNDIFTALKDHLLPRFDQSFATLLIDLEQRGLLETTLVVCMGEFGRAPLVALEPRFAGSSPGRKHWAGVYSVIMAGAGVTRGAVVGSSDRTGSYPESVAVGPWDVAATMFAALGVDPSGHYTDLTGRPYVLTNGKAIGELYR
jgi:hypothetical protein